MEADYILAPKVQKYKVYANLIINSKVIKEDLEVLGIVGINR